MFKAINLTDATEVIILDPAWSGRVEDLRTLSHGDQLVCQGCRQPVRVRAGAIKQRHFAHKHLRDCSYGHDSPLLLKLRALLYTRLVAEFGPAVTLEKQIDGVNLPRPVDCWVQREAGDVAYWIVEAALRPQARDAVSAALVGTGARVHWLFASVMLRLLEDDEKAVNLTTTERELTVTTPFDTELEGAYYINGGTLHYLNPETSELTTFRSLHLIHAPQVYRGRVLVSPFFEVLVARKTGEFAHEGERERLHQLQEEKARLEQLEAQRREEERLRAEQGRAASPPAVWWSPGSSTEPSSTASLHVAPRSQPNSDIEDRLAAFSRSKEGTCVFCGEKTSSWWWYDGKTGECKCGNCQKAGRS